MPVAEGPLFVRDGTNPNVGQSTPRAAAFPEAPPHTARKATVIRHATVVFLAAGMSEGLLTALVSLLRQEGADFEVTHHDAVTTSAEAAAVRGTELRSGAKAMLVKTKGDFVLAVLAADRRVDWKRLGPLVGDKGARFANDDELRDATGLSKGAVPPLGNLFGLRTIYDESLLDVESVNFNAGSHTDSVAMSRADLVRIGGGEVAAFSKD